MTKFYHTLVSLLITAGVSSAQSLSVEKIQNLSGLDEGAFFHPRFSPSGQYVLFTGAGFRGLYLYEIADGGIRQLNDEPGAGYEPVFTANSDAVIYRNQVYRKRLKYSELKMQYLGSGEREVLQSESRHLSPPQVQSGDILWMADREPSRYNTLSREKSALAANTTPLCLIERGKIVMVRNGEKNLIQPLGEGNYIWPAISPDGSRLLFTKAGRGTFISDLEGNILSELGYANAPRWSPDGNWVVCMVDIDDGHKILESDIYAVSADGEQRIQLTFTEDQIEMYPRWHPSGMQVVCGTERGEIVIIYLERG